jgi:hypothetical protein
VQLPASEIDWCGFHGFGVWLVRLEADGYTRMRINFGFFYKLYPIGYSLKQLIPPTGIGQGLDLRPESVGAG